jgi:hypothetical protein
VENLVNDFSIRVCSADIKSRRQELRMAHVIVGSAISKQMQRRFDKPMEIQSLKLSLPAIKTGPLEPTAANPVVRGSG